MSKTYNNVQEYVSDMRETLLRGDEFLIEGVGVLKPVYRNVKNETGRNFTVRVRMDYFKDFYNEIIESCKRDSSKFRRKAKAINNVEGIIERDSNKECRTYRAINN